MEYCQVYVQKIPHPTIIFIIRNSCASERVCKASDSDHIYDN